MKIASESFIRAKPLIISRTAFTLPPLEKVFDLGIDKYLEYLYAIIMDFDAFRSNEEIQAAGEMSDFDLFIYLLFADNGYKEIFFESVEFFSGDRFVLTENGIASIKKRLPDGAEVPVDSEEDGELFLHDLLTEVFWTTLRKAFCVGHWVPVPQDKGKLTGKAAEIAEKLRRNKEEVARIKAKNQKTEASTDVYELVASVAANSPSYNLFNIWDLNYYQFFDHFKRIQLKEEYQYSLEQILAGVDPKKLDIRHWSSSIQTQN